MTPSNNSESLAQVLEQDENYRVLRKFNPDALYRLDAICDNAGFAAILDTETTGRDPETDKIIELGLVIVAYSRSTGALLSVVDTFNALEDPGMPIPEDAARINGITDAMVAGLRIDDDLVQQMISDVDFVIAHNAGFDRAFCEKRFPFFKGKPWACSVSQIDWEAEGISSAKLEFIAYRLGFFFSAHRAEMDCLALAYALSLPLPSGQCSFSQLLPHLKVEHRRLWAVNASFDKKDLLKARGYRWSAGDKPNSEKAWWIEVPLESFEEELAWLKESIYDNRSFSIPVDRIDAFSRFAERRDKLERTYY